MWSLAEINRLNTSVEIAKEQFLARAMNNPKDWRPRKPRLRIGLSQKLAKECAQ